MNEILEIDTKKVNEQSTSICTVAKSLQIGRQKDMEEAARLMRDIKGIKRQIDDTFDPHIKSAHEQHKALLATKAKFIVPLDEAERLLKNRTGKYLQVQEELRQEEQRRLEAEARAVEQARRDAEIAALKAQAEAAAKAAASKQEAKAILAEVKEEAKAIEAAPVVIAVQAVAPVPKVNGVSSTVIWKYRIVNSDLIPRVYMMPNERMIADIVRARHEAAEIPGVEVYTEKQINVRY